VRVLGTRHSFTGMADSAELVSLRRLPADLVVDHMAGTVSFGAGLTYGELAPRLQRVGLALHNLASLPHLSVAGAVATASHGSGDASGNLATAVAALQLVTSGGEVVTATRGEPDFDGMVVGLGALGAVTRLTLDAQPVYQVRQRVYEKLPWPALYERFDELMACGDSVSVFTRWQADAADQVWVKCRADDPCGAGTGELFGATAATAARHPIPGLDPSSCTPQLGRPGAWWRRLPHFRPGSVPSSGDELQSEYLVPRRHGVAAIRAVHAMAARIRPVLLVSELRTVAADGLWLSPQHRRDTVCIHFTWRPQPRAVRATLAELEAALAPFEPRPHWGKLFLAGAATIAASYPRHADFLALADRLDPRGAFRNEWLNAHVRGREW
jgi:xylitol oxidase